MGGVLGYMGEYWGTCRGHWGTWGEYWGTCRDTGVHGESTGAHGGGVLGHM